MADPPGKVLSSLTAASDTRHSKAAGCAGAFFHFFDWNLRFNGKRLFRHNLLPAERLKQYSANHNDDKLPMAKLLLIADENRGAMGSKTKSGEVVSKPEAADIDPHRRTPGVVARLMGLETMPSPEPRRERNEEETNFFAHEYDLNQEMFRNRPEMVGNAEWHSCPVEWRREPFKRKAIGLDRKQLEKYPGGRSSAYQAKVVARRSAASNQQEEPDVGSARIHIRRVTDRLQEPKAISFTMLPPLSAQQADATRRSILSPSESHNRVVSPSKMPSASKRTVRTFNAASKDLKLGMLSNTLSANFDIQSQLSELEFDDVEDGFRIKESSAPFCAKRASYRPRSSSVFHTMSKSPSETSPDPKKRRIEQSSSPRMCNTFADQSLGIRQDEVIHRGKIQAGSTHEKKLGKAGDWRLEHRNPSMQQVANKRVSYPSTRQEVLSQGVRESKNLAAGKRSGRGTNVNEKPKAQCNSDLQELEQARAGNDIGCKPDFRRQEESSRRLGQPVTSRNQNFKRQGAKPDRAANSIRGREAQFRNIRAISPQLSRVSANAGAHSESSDRLTVISSGSSASSNSTVNAAVGSADHGSFDNPEENVGRMTYEGSKCMETANRRKHSSLARSLLRRRAETERMASSAPFMTADQFSQFETTIVSEYQEPASLHGNLLKHLSSQSEAGATEHSSRDYGESFLQYESQEVVPNHSQSQIIAVESPSCSYSSPRYVSDAVNHPDVRDEENINDSTFHQEHLRARWGTCDRSAIETLISGSTVRSSDEQYGETRSPSCCDFSLGNFRDTLSRVHPVAGSGRRECVSYSGKTTAAILQELLVALNSSKEQFTVEEKESEIAEDSRISSTDTTLEAATCREPDEKRGSLCGTPEYNRENACDSADLRGTERMSCDVKEFPIEGGCLHEDRKSISGSLCAEEFGHPSPTSILESPFQYESSNSSDSFESTKEAIRQEGEGNEHFECTSTIGSQTEDGDTAESRGFGDCDELIDTISRLHRIDPADFGLSATAKGVSESEEQYVKDILGASKLCDDHIYAGQLQLSASFIDQAVFNRFEEQVQRWDWGIFCPEEDDAESICRSEIESNYEEAAALSRKLIFDCISDALRSIFLLGRRVSGLCWQPNLQFSPVYLTQSVQRQMKDWKGMACSMNVDTMVETEMNTLTGSWCDFCDEILEIAEELERNIFRGLIEELVTDVSKSFYKVPA